MATSIVYTEFGDIRVRTSDGRLVHGVSLSQLAFDADLREIARKAMEQPGIEVEVPSTSSARGLRPRNSVMHGISQ